MADQVSGDTARKQIADLARRWAARAVLGIVRESGGQVIDRPAFRDRPDLDLKVTGASPIAGLQAAAGLRQAARSLTLTMSATRVRTVTPGRTSALPSATQTIPIRPCRQRRPHTSTQPEARQPGTHSRGRACNVGSRSLTAVRTSDTQRIAKKATPTAAPAWQRRSPPGPPHGMTRPTNDR